MAMPQNFQLNAAQNQSEKAISPQNDSWRHINRLTNAFPYDSSDQFFTTDSFLSSEISHADP